MANLVVKDNSLGEAIGLLGSAYSNATNPKTQWEAYNLKQRVEHTQLLNQKLAEDAAQEARKQEALRQVEESLGQVAARTVQGMPATIEPGRVDFNGQQNPAFNGPYQQPLESVTNPGILNAEALRRAAVLAARSGKDSYDLTRQNLGYNMVAGGLPQREGDARLAQTFIGGGIPNASTPLTEEQRRVMEREEAANKLRQSVSIPGGGGGVAVSAEQATALGQPVNPDGPTVLTMPQAPSMFPKVYGGESESAMDNNIVLGYFKLLREGHVPTPDQQAAYDLARRRLEATQTTFGPGGVPRTITPPPLESSVGRQPPNMTPRPLGANPALQPPAPAPTDPALQPPAPAPAPAGGAAGGATAGGGQRVVEKLADGTKVEYVLGQPDPPAEHIVKKSQRIQTMDESGKQMKQMLAAGYRPSLTGEVLGPMAQPGGGGIKNALQTGLMRWGQGQFAPEDQAFISHATSFLNEVLRDDSGAAVPESEYPRYIAAMIPAFGDTEAVIQSKQRRMDMAVEARRQGLKVGSIAAIALGQNPAATALGAPPPPAGGPAPAPAPAAPQPAPAGSQEAVRHRQEYDKALAAIEASGAPPAAKAAAKAEAQRRFSGLITPGSQ